MKKSMNTVNYEMSIMMLNEMPEQKRQVLRKALERSLSLTSVRTMEEGTLTIYKEGFYLELKGTRSSFKLFATDNDGELEFSRKPVESKLHKMYSDTIKFCEADFDNI